MPELLFHYTDAAGYDAIISNPLTVDGIEFVKLLSSSKALAGDAHYGDGWYFTDLPPYGGDRTKIARALWDSSFLQNLSKTEYFFAFRFHGNTTVVPCRKHVFFVPATSNARPILWAHGRVRLPEKLPPGSPAEEPVPPERESFTKADLYRLLASDFDYERYTEHYRKKPSMFRRILRWLGF